MLVQVEMGERQLDSFADLLLLHVETTNIGVRHVGLLVGTQHSDGGIGLRREDIDEGVGMAVEGDRGRRLELLAVERREDADNVVGSGAGLDNAGAGGQAVRRCGVERGCV